MKDFNEWMKNKAANEATNHLGEQSFNDYYKWKAACKALGANRWDGNKDTCNAFKELLGTGDLGSGMAKKFIGEWDGEKGYIGK